MYLVAVLAGCGQKEDRPVVQPSQVAKKSDDQQATQPHAKQSEQQTQPGAFALNDVERTRAKNLYTQHCAACHGEKGDGKEPQRRWHR